MEKYHHSFQPITIGKVEVKNRYFMAPMGGVGQSGPQCEFSERAAVYYIERARGGVGAIFTGVAFSDVKIDPIIPGKNVNPLYAPSKFMETATPMCERVHAYGSKIFMQLSLGTGRNGGLATASEAPAFWDPQTTCRALSVDEIKLKIDQEAQAALIAKNSGFDGVEVHAIHEGYLLDQFAMSYMNKREDEYGGSLENRMRFAIETCRAIKDACGQDFPVTVRLGLKTYIKGFNQASYDGEGEVGRSLEEGLTIAKLLADNGVDALSVDTGVYDSFYYVHPPMYQPKGLNLELAAKAKEVVRIPILTAGRIDEPEIAEEAIKNGQTDGIVIGRALLADAEFCNKAKRGEEEAIRPCLSCHVGCVGRIFVGKPMGCAVNPTVLREREMDITPALAQKNVMVVGGGIAGMEAARVAKARGHTVALYEKSGQMGGNLLAAGGPDFKVDDRHLIAWYKRELKQLGVPVKLNMAVSAEMAMSENADVILLATGAVPIMPAIPGIDHDKSVSCVDALTAKKELGQRVVVIGGGLVGCELALDQAKKGKSVVIVEALPQILASGNPVPVPNAMMLKDMLAEHHVEIRTGWRITAVDDNGACISNGDKTETIPADSVAFAIGFRSERKLYQELASTGKVVVELGDGKQVANILAAVWDAYEVARFI